MAARATGGLIGVVGLAALGDRSSKGRLLLGSSVVFGLSLVAFSQSPTFLFAMAALLVSGIAAGAFDALQQTALQLAVEADQRGRSMGVWVVSLGIGPLGHLEVGAFAQAAGASAAILLNGSVLALVGLVIAFASPRLRRL
ncbi:MAG: MFS transporter [Chloroflexi bacterium]|nr:MFS transporter [Chloroflexota bacterium]